MSVGAFWSAFTLCVLSSWAAQAAGPRPGDLCVNAIQQAEQAHGTPPGLLLTIAKVESGHPDGAGGVTPWPWVIDADGMGQFFDSGPAAVAGVQQALLRGARFVDVGCMQVDLQMHPTAFRSLTDAFDPMLNADYGARFLRALHDGPARGNWYVAVGLYHSSTPDLAADYRAAVTAVGAGLLPHLSGGGPRVGAGRIYLALAGGGATRLNLNRQPARVHRRMSNCQIAAVLGSFLRSRPRC